MMRDLTLIVPTCGRPQLLSAFLRYLEAERADCRVLVLNSSSPDVLAITRARAACFSLDLEFMEIPEVEPGEICRQGIGKVFTPFCALCPDEDVVILNGMQRCLDVLRGDPKASVAHGYSFLFLPRADGNIELNGVMPFSSTSQDSSPIGRLGNLCRPYQPLSSGVFRTVALQRIFESLRSIGQALARDLLLSALAVIAGRSLFLHHFSYGRRRRSSLPYNHADPLEWFCTDPEGLFAEYLRYRELLAGALMQRPENDLQREEVFELVDLMHLRYLAQYAPDSLLESIIEREVVGLKFRDHLPRQEAYSHRFESSVIRDSQVLGPVELRSRERCYLLFPAFYAPSPDAPLRLDDFIGLIGNLDNYQIGDEDA